MPASQKVDVFRGLEAEIEPVCEEPDVYFTDQSPKFILRMHNDTEYNFVEGSELRWVIGIGSGMPEAIYEDDIEFEVPPGETREYEIGGKVLAFEGHGVIGVDSGGAKGRGDPDYELRSGRGTTYDPAYTFSVWDRSQYESIHENPKKLQRIAMFLSGAIVFFSIVQLAISVLRVL